ncbi:TetR/AcrR family transcriptional regulator [Actinoplanes sp. NPDC051494]|uniref:TetR/AcrR family transcriptional regulator n=1 Tax=Actinoplanes sp. NPDC051494 TaxID=3363907 RepID=UPI0037A4FAFC
MAKQSQRLSRDVLIDCAMTLADAEGLGAVTIRRLAQENGVTPMAMYWHFNDKEALLDAMAAHLVGAVKLPAATDAPWDAQLRDVLDAIAVALRPHPTVAGMAARQVLIAEAGLELTERVLALLATAGLEPRRAAEVATFLFCSVVALVAGDPGQREVATDEDRESRIRYKTASLAALPPARFPHLIAAAPGLVSCFGQDDFFDLNLDLLVQGVRGIR